MAARLAWDYELRQVDVARRLGVSAPAVSQLLENARKAMRLCLKRNGLIGEGLPLTRKSCWLLSAIPPRWRVHDVNTRRSRAGRREEEDGSRE